MKDETFLWPVFKKTGSVEMSEGGITKREYFALQLLTNSDQPLNPYNTELAILCADKLIEELEK